MAFLLDPHELDTVEEFMFGNNKFRVVSGVRGPSIDLELEDIQSLLSKGLPDETVEIHAARFSDWGAKAWHTIWRAPRWDPRGKQ